MNRRSGRQAAGPGGSGSSRRRLAGTLPWAHGHVRSLRPRAPRRFADDRVLLDLFFGEVRNARQVSHPNVCRVYDIGELEGAPFLSMEYVDGEDLATLLRRIGRLPAAKATEVARQLCAGLAAA